MRKPLYLLFLLALLTGCTTCSKNNAEEAAAPADSSAPSVTLQNQPAQPVDSSEIILQQAKPPLVPDSAKVSNKVIKLPNGGWGYYVYVDGQAMIYQDVIPGVNTSAGFANEKEAKIVADVVSEKLRNNIIPPAISVKELRDLGITLPKEN